MSFMNKSSQVSIFSEKNILTYNCHVCEQQDVPKTKKRFIDPSYNSGGDDNFVFCIYSFKDSYNE